MKYSIWTKRDWYYCSISIYGKQKIFALRTKNKEEAEQQAIQLCKSHRILLDVLDFYLDYPPDRAERTEELAIECAFELKKFLGDKVYASKRSPGKL